MKLGIIIDSASGYTVEQCNKKKWGYVPLLMVLDGVEYADGENLDDKKFRSIININTKVSSGCSSLPLLQKIYKKMLKNFDEVIYYPLSEKLSSQNNNAKIAARDFKNVHVISSRMMSSVIGEECVYAEKMAKNGKKIDEIVEILNRRSLDSIGMIVPSNMTWLKKGGRINASTAALGKLLNIHPILRFDGGMDKWGKTRTALKSIIKGYEGLKKELNSGIDHDIYLLHSVFDPKSPYVKKLKIIKNRLEKIDNKNIYLRDIPRILVIHTYLDMIAVYFVPKKG